MKNFISPVLFGLMGFASLTVGIAGCNEPGTSGLDGLDNATPLPDGLVYSNEEVGEREDGTGAFRTHCLESHESFDDPLVYPNQPGKAHHHIFFGNPTVDAFTTATSLSEATETTCDGNTLNRSAYWVPALYDQSGERIDYGEPLFYYKTGYHVPAASIQVPPEGLQMIAGNAAATEPQGTTAIKYRCDSWQSDQEWFDPGDPLDHVDVLPACPIGDILEIRIVFPQCWDGVHLNSDDQNSHMAYPSEAEPPVAGTGSCPASHPIAIPEISYNFGLYVTDDRGTPDTWYFSSDIHSADMHSANMHSADIHSPDLQVVNPHSTYIHSSDSHVSDLHSTNIQQILHHDLQAFTQNENHGNEGIHEATHNSKTMGGITLHADWMNGWEPDIMETIVQECLRPARECMVGLLGNGTRLESILDD